MKIIADNKYNNTFSGYYNISPWNKNGEFFFYSTQVKSVRGSKYSKLYIYINRSGYTKYEEIASTSSWNWQQGCLAHWLSKDEIIYNDYDYYYDKYYSVKININSLNKTSYDLPIYAISNNGKYSLSLNFSRLALYRPDYGYFNKREDVKFNDKQDGIWITDLTNGKYKLILSLENLKRFNSDDTMNCSDHWVNHLDFSPNNKRFMFIHRWVNNNNMKYHRLITANLDGSDLWQVAGNKKVSHSFWFKETEIISYSYINGIGLDYYIFRDKNENFKFLAKNLFSRDGHPSVNKYNMLITDDSYPDKAQFKKLYLYDINNGNLYILGKYYHPLKYSGEYRCDLHPKWDNTGKYIGIDVIFKNKRKFCVLDCRKIID